ncbi:lipopolysaccharide biosynthesis protein RfbH [Acidimicrobiia bacterium]|nr:lipopolysaccharide biosynthesis protein RfbH [Acidimicrobiia bacterium]
MDYSNQLKLIEKKILELSKQYFQIKFSNTDFIPFISQVPVSGKVLSYEDLKYTILSTLDMWYTSGEYTKKFEKEISKKLGARHCLFVNSGSSANLLAITALKEYYRLDDGDEIITSAVGFPTTINPIIQNNLIPVLIDAEEETLNINTDLIESHISDKTKGIVIAHTLGNPFDLEKIIDLCKKYDLFLMEDNCDAFGSKFNQKFTGTFGDVSTLSFYPAHHITTGEGGAVITDNTKLKKIMESIRDWGRDCYCPPGKDNTCKKRYEWQLGELPKGYDHKYIYSHIGYNLKASDMQAALGFSQINKLDEFIKIRKRNYQYLYNSFKSFKEFKLISNQVNSEPSWFGFPVILKNNKNFTRNDLLKFYEERNIGTRLLFGGNLKRQPAYSNLNFKSSTLSVADNIIENCFWLGVYPGLELDMLKFVVDSTKEFLDSYEN